MSCSHSPCPTLPHPVQASSAISTRLPQRSQLPMILSFTQFLVRSWRSRVSRAMIFSSPGLGTRQCIRGWFIHPPLCSIFSMPVVWSLANRSARFRSLLFHPSRGGEKKPPLGLSWAADCQALLAYPPLSFAGVPLCCPVLLHILYGSSNQKSRGYATCMIANSLSPNAIQFIIACLLTTNINNLIMHSTKCTYNPYTTLILQWCMLCESITY
jgi:hypothetical protein